MLEFRVLGQLEVTSDGHPVSIDTAHKPRLVLAVLLAQSGQAVSTEKLIDAVWGYANPPASARRNVQLYVHRLRHALGTAAITSSLGGYVIARDAALDARRFQALTEEGGRALDNACPESAANLLRAALDLWRGDAFAEFAECEFIANEIARLDQLHLTTYEKWAEAELLLGRHADVIDPLTRLKLKHPYHEGIRAHLMAALQGVGRQADALQIFRETRKLLCEKLGIEPGDKLQRVHRDILRGAS
ncbi:AfsR/SARP family transcriptional regulator [Micromonospora sp. NPDC126480]|uniref:AfsR/SARP family transcriptional regulator n=1 Tax=Micromonospora sp. NPDC126480 TaxID=3155312 RepID=UPI00332E1BD8